MPGTTREDRTALEAISLGATCVYSSVLAIGDGCLGVPGSPYWRGRLPFCAPVAKAAPRAATREVSRKWLQSKASKGLRNR